MPARRSRDQDVMAHLSRTYRVGIAGAATVVALGLYTAAIVLWPRPWYGRSLAILLALAAYAAAEIALAMILVPASDTTPERRYSYDQVRQGVTVRDRSRKLAEFVLRSIIALTLAAGLIWLVHF